MTLSSTLLRIQYSGIARVPLAQVLIGPAFGPSETPPAGHQFPAIWDTGASGTAITQRVADVLGLKPTGVMQVFHAQGEEMVNTYLVSLSFPGPGPGFASLKVNEAKLNGADVLIGTDVICQGDLLFTNENGKSELIFNYPSIGLDRLAKLVKGHPMPTAPVLPPPSIIPVVHRNAPCPCGSGKKYRDCCRNKPKGPTAMPGSA